MARDLWAIFPRVAAPLMRVFFSMKGRLTRGPFVLAAAALLLFFIVLFVFFETMVDRAATWILYPPFFFSAFAIATRRLHDLGHSAWRLLILLIPALGPLWLSIVLVFIRGSRGENAYGPDPLEDFPDYLAVDIHRPGPQESE